MTHFISIRTAALLSLAALTVAGCSDSGPARAPIQGLVTLGGQPLAAGRILFTPAAPNQGPATSARIVNGEYELPSEEGPIVGTNRIQIEADLDLGFALDDEQAFARRGGKPLPPNPVPPEFNANSTIVVDVKAGDENTYDVTIPQSRQVVARPQF
jgi:hypothetical protein